MDGRIFGALVLLAGLVQIYRRVRAKGDAINDVVTALALPNRRFLMPRLRLGVDQSEAEEAQCVLQSLNETIRLKLNPGDPQSVQQAIRQLDQDIDAKIAPYRHNKIVVEVAAKLKSEYRQLLQKQVEKLAPSTRERR